MPTGYTADVVDGKITEFRAFALQCARAFGALITMRDDPFNAPIPDAIPPHSYHTERYVEAEERLARLRSLTPEQAEIEALQAYEKAAEYAVTRNAEIDRENGRLAAMAAKVNAWTPPTPDHVEMKRFMLNQLEISKTTYRNDLPERMPAAAWLAKEIASAEHDLNYHAKEQKAENERSTNRTAWIKALKTSI